MEQFKKAQVIMLPTENETEYNQLELFSQYNNLQLYKGGSSIGKPQHLYIISDDEIKEGDWFMLNEEHPQGRLRQCYHISDNNRLWNGENWDTLKGKHYFIQPTEKGSGFVTELECKKIIATTDTSLKVFIDGNGNKSSHELTKSGYVEFLPQPSQQFIEKYIEFYNKGEVITDVLVEYELISNEEYFGNTVNPDDDIPYFDERLKINPKDNTITIKKVKDSWSRKELEVLFKKHENDIIKYINSSGSSASPSFNCKWIKENL